MAPIYRKSASCTLTWARFTVNQLQAGLHGSDIQYISPKQACVDSIYSKSASSRLAWTRFTVNQLQAGLHGLDIQYISFKQACMAPIYSISAPSRLAWPDIQYIKHHNLPQKEVPRAMDLPIHARGTFSCDRQSARLTDDRRRCHLGEADDYHGPQAPCSLRVSA